MKILKDGLFVSTRRDVENLQDIGDLKLFAKEWFDYRGMPIPKNFVIDIIED